MIFVRNVLRSVLHPARVDPFGMLKKCEQESEFATSSPDSYCVESNNVQPSWLRGTKDITEVYFTVSDMETVRKWMV